MTLYKNKYNHKLYTIDKIFVHFCMDRYGQLDATRYMISNEVILNIDLNDYIKVAII